MSEETDKLELLYERYCQRRDALNAAVATCCHLQNPDPDVILETADCFLEWLTRLERIN